VAFCTTGVTRLFFCADVFRLSFVKGSLISPSGVCGANDTERAVWSFRWVIGLSGTSDSRTVSSSSSSFEGCGLRVVRNGDCAGGAFKQTRLLTCLEDDDEGVEERGRFLGGVSITIPVPSMADSTICSPFMEIDSTTLVRVSSVTGLDVEGQTRKRKLRATGFPHKSRASSFADQRHSERYDGTSHCE
jgi:hypothetical protein